MKPPAQRLYRAVEHYLAGSLNESALEAWRLAIGHESLSTLALDSKIERICAAFLRAERGT